MATYAEMAPILSEAGVTKTAVETYFENLPEDPEPIPDPSITKAKIVAIANAYLVDGMEASNGILGIARAVSLKPYQVKAVINEINVLKAAWDALQEEPVV